MVRNSGLRRAYNGVLRHRLDWARERGLVGDTRISDEIKIHYQQNATTHTPYLVSHPSRLRPKLTNRPDLRPVEIAIFT